MIEFYQNQWPHKAKQCSYAASKRFNTLVQTHTGHFRGRNVYRKTTEIPATIPSMALTSAGWHSQSGAVSVPKASSHPIEDSTSQLCKWPLNAFEHFRPCYINDIKRNRPKKPLLCSGISYLNIRNTRDHNTFSYISRFPHSVAHVSKSLVLRRLQQSSLRLKP